MKHSDFKIGQHFQCSGVDKVVKWRCTDTGTRVIIAIKIESDTRMSDGWYNGPPYAVEERVFDEFDFAACEALKG
jgi:hypothetical protein